MRKIRPRVFRPPELTKQVKTSLAVSLLHSRLFYNACLWPELGAASFRTIHHAYVSTARAVVGKWNLPDKPHVADDQVLKQVGWAPLEWKVDLILGKYFARLIRVAPAPLRALVDLSIQHRSPWWLRLSAALQRIQARSPELHVRRVG